MNIKPLSPTTFIRLIAVAYKIKHSPKLLAIKKELEEERFELQRLAKKHKKSSKGALKVLRPSFYNMQELTEDLEDQREIFRLVEAQYVEHYQKHASSPIKRKAVSMYNRIPTYLFALVCVIAAALYVIINCFDSPAYTMTYLKNAGCISLFVSIILLKPKDI